MQFLRGAAYDGDAGDPVELFRTPGYPALLALIYGSVGRHYGNVALVQLILGGASCLGLFSILRREAGPGAAFLLSGFYALDPTSTFWATTVMAETLFTFTVVAALYCLWRWWGGASWRWTLLGGVLAGLSALVRPIGTLLLPLWSGMVLLRAWKAGSEADPSGSRSRSAMLKGGAAFLAAIALALAPYMFYNLRVWGVFTLSSVDTFNLGRYHAAPLLMESEGIPLEQALEELEVSYLPQPGARGRYWAVIGQAPLTYAKLFAAGDLVVLFWPEYHRWFGLFDISFHTRGALEQLLSGNIAEAVKRLAGYLGDEPLTGIALAFSISYQLGMYGLALLGGARTLRSGGLTPSGKLWVLLLVLTALVLLLSPGPVGEQRFRIPAQPALILLGASLASQRGRHREQSGPVGEFA